MNRNIAVFPGLAARCFSLLLAASLWALAPAARAEDDPPGRVGRVAEFQGGVSLYDTEQGQWGGVTRNRPLTTGDRLSTDHDARAELRIGSVTLRLGGNTEMEVLRLDDQRISVQLHSGSLALRVRSREVAQETEVVTAETKLRPLRSGHYRVDRIDDNTYAGSWRGELRVDDGGEPFTIDSGRREEIWREGQRRLRHQPTSLPSDDFGQWAQREDRSDERSASHKYVSPEMTGAEALDRHGRWDQHPEFGAVWFPRVVVDGWAPYRHGHWAWVRPWGWTWVDDAPWGFAPFHYGRWVSWHGRWGWVPGTYVRRPVYAPALVAWVGTPGVSVSISLGGGASVGWVPLAPRERYVPHYRHTPGYIDHVNTPQPGGWRNPPLPPSRPVRPGPISGAAPAPHISYGNQGVPNAVTVVPRDVLLRREPVARAVVPISAPQQQNTQVMAAPPAPPVRATEGDDGRANPNGPRMRIQPVRPPMVQGAPAMGSLPQSSQTSPASPALPPQPAMQAGPSAPRQPAAPNHPAVPMTPQPVPVQRGTAPAAVEVAPHQAPVVDLRQQQREQAQREQTQREQAQREREQAQREREQAQREREQREVRDNRERAVQQPVPRQRAPEREEARPERRPEPKAEPPKAEPRPEAKPEPREERPERSRNPNAVRDAAR